MKLILSFNIFTTIYFYRSKYISRIKCLSLYLSNTVTFNEAEQYLHKQRNIDTATYNFNRLHEEPIPEISENDNSISDDDSTDDTAGLDNSHSHLSAEGPSTSIEKVLTNNELGQNEMENENLSAQDPLASVEFEEASAQHDVENNENQQVESDQNPLSTENNSSTDVKPDVYPIHTVNLTRNSGIMALLAEREVIEIDDDMTITVGPEGFGAPLKTMPDGRVKIETADNVSGKIEFMSTVSGFEILLIFNDIIRLTKFIVYRKSDEYTKLVKIMLNYRTKSLQNLLFGISHHVNQMFQRIEILF